MEPSFLQITIERQFDARVDTENHAIGILGGVVHGLRADGTPGGPTTHHAVRWEGTTLVFERGSYTGGNPARRPWSERRETWSLDPDGRLRVVTTTHGSDQPDGAQTLLYRRHGIP